MDTLMLEAPLLNLDQTKMAIKISTLLTKIQLLPNEQNKSTIVDFYNYMPEKESSEIIRLIIS